MYIFIFWVLFCTLYIWLSSLLLIAVSDCCACPYIDLIRNISVTEQKASLMPGGPVRRKVKLYVGNF